MLVHSRGCCGEQLGKGEFANNRYWEPGHVLYRAAAEADNAFVQQRLHVY